ncbi:MAG: tetratricopeptide repeat protein [Elusimicrobiota bacterium]
MKVTTMTASRTALTLAMAVLLFTPPAIASKIRRASHPKMNHFARLWMAEGLADLKQGRPSAAIKAFNKAVGKQGSVSTYFLLGWAHSQRAFKLGATETANRDDAQSAIDAYAMALAIDPALKELPNASRLHLSMALCQEAVMAYDKALESYKSALRASPRNALIPLHAARLRLKMNDNTKALANIKLALTKAGSAAAKHSLRDASRRDPVFASLLADAEAREKLGVSAEDVVIASIDVRSEEMRDSVRDTAAAPAPPAQDQAVLAKIAEGNMEFKFRRYESALSAYRRALEMDEERPTLGSGQIGTLNEKIGTAFNKIGQADEALPFLRKALTLNPLNVQARYQVAVSYALTGRNVAALNSLRVSLDSCASASDLRRLVMQSKSDLDLTGLRGARGFGAVIAQYGNRIAMR